MTHCSIVDRSCTPGISSLPSSSHAGVPVTPTSCAASIEARTSSAPSRPAPRARLVATGAAARDDVREPLRIADVHPFDEDRREQRSVEACECLEVVGAHDLRGALGEPSVRDVLGRSERQPDGGALRADPRVHLGEPAGGRYATPRRRQLGMEVVGEWSDRDAELFEERVRSRPR